MRFKELDEELQDLIKKANWVKEAGNLDMAGDLFVEAAELCPDNNFTSRLKSQGLHLKNTVFKQKREAERRRPMLARWLIAIKRWWKGESL